MNQSEDGQVSLTDEEARAVIHKRNIVQVGYNVHATADGQHNLIVDVFSKGVNDTYGLSEAGKRAKEILEKDRFDLLADKGYHTGLELGRRLLNYWLDLDRDVILVAGEPKNADIARLYRVFLAKDAGKRSSERIRAGISTASPE